MIGIIASLIGIAVSAINGNWTAALWAFCAFGWATVAYLERKNVQRYKTLAAARSWPQIGTVRSDGTIRNGGPGYEVWNGKVWVKV